MKKSIAFVSSVLSLALLLFGCQYFPTVEARYSENSGKVQSRQAELRDEASESVSPEEGVASPEVQQGQPEKSPTISEHWFLGEASLPAFGLIDLKSETLKADDIRAITQLTWAQLFSKKIFRMPVQSVVREVLDRERLDPQISHFSKSPMALADALRVNYLGIGHINKVGAGISMDISIFSYPEGRAVSSQFLSGNSIDVIISKIPALIDSIVVDFENYSKSADAVTKRQPEEIQVISEVAPSDEQSELKKEMAQLQQKIVGLESTIEELQYSLTSRNKDYTMLEMRVAALEHLEEPEAQRPDDAATDAQDAVSPRLLAEEYYKKSLLIEDPWGKQEHIELLLKALELAPDNSLYMTDLARSYHIQGNPREAVELCRKAILLNPASSLTYLIMGAAYFDLTEFQKAVEAYQAALNHEPENLNAHYSLALALEKINAEKAKQAWKEYLKNAAGVPEQQRWFLDAQKRLERLEEQ